ncbi:MAG TPA: hypothetical protein VEU29_05510, partial [Actinomycetota bacterium]|nr:hypothetical protein [Actinomycetota bacterium]
MGGSSGGSKSWGVVVAAALIVAASPPAATAPEPAASAASVRFPIPLPAPVEALAARERASGSNLMFAQIVAAPHKGYHWSAVAYKARPSAGTFLALTFARTRAQGTQTQSSVFSWDLPRGALRMASDLRPASLATGKAMGSNGSISMKLSKRGRYARVPAGDGCTGTISVRIARFAGRFRFHARDEYFKRISFREAQVFLYREHDYSCPGEPPPPPGCPRFL